MITINFKIEKEPFKKMGDMMMPVLMRSVKRALLVLEAEIKKSARTYLRHTSATQYRNRRSGRLRNSFTHKGPFKRGNTIRGIVGSNVPYARIHEEGGTITARNALALTIPLPGKNFGTARMLKAEGNTFIKNDLIYLRVSRTRVIPIFALRQTVQIPARHYISKGMKIALPRIQRVIGKGIAMDFNE